MRAGTYYIGDLCYVVPNNEWLPLLKRTNYLEGSFTYRGRECFSGSTAYGDGGYYGCYCDEDDREYLVDSGSIGIMPVEVIRKNKQGRGGQIITFKYDFEPQCHNGLFIFGAYDEQVVIDTKESCDDDSE